MVEKVIKELIKIEIEEKKKSLEEEKIIEENKEKKINTSKEKFKEKGSLELERIKINKNKIVISFDRRYVFKKNINEIFNYNELLLLDYRWLSELDIYEKFKEKSADYIKEDLEGNKWNKNYEIKFGDGKVKINGVKITTSRMPVVINNYYKNISKEGLKLLNKLSLMKIEILEMKDIKCRNVDLDINVSFIDDNTFKIKIMNITKQVSWELIKKYFFYGRSKRNPSNSEIIKFIAELGIKKQDFYNHIRKIVLINELDDKNET